MSILNHLVSEIESLQDSSLHSLTKSPDGALIEAAIAKIERAQARQQRNRTPIKQNENQSRPAECAKRLNNHKYFRKKNDLQISLSQ